MKINIKPSESVTIIGRNGSGKTVLLNHLIELSKPTGKQRNLILDTKQVGDYDMYPSVSRLKDVAKMVATNGTVVYKPIDSEANDLSYIDGFFEFAYDRWNTRVIIDEMSSIVDNNNMTTNYINIMDRGRARHVTFYQATQKPVFIPHAALSEAAHFFVFDLTMEDARKKVSKMGLGDSALIRPTDPYGFWYYYVKDREPSYHQGLKL